MKEEDIRKRDAFDRYIRMVKKDIDVFFNDRSTFCSIPCPACNEEDSAKEFEKAGFAYVLCKKCGTLFVNPRPAFEHLSDFYFQSHSSSFWVNEFFKPVAEVRREQIFRPRAEYIAQKFGNDPKWIIGDIGSGFGLFLEELTKTWPSSKLIGIEASEEMSEICASKGFEVLCCPMEDIKGWDGAFDLLTSFELFEHIFSPQTFLFKVKKLLRPGGRLFLTTLNGEGFDIQVLWEKSKSIFPPLHLNFLNPQSMKSLLERSGFILEEISTPGKLDWDIVEGMIKNEGFDVNRFWNLFYKNGTEKGKEDLQEWITKNGFSSHMRVIAKKGI